MISVSFVLSGRKLGSEAFTILSHDGAGLPRGNSRKTSAASSVGSAAQQQQQQQQQDITDELHHQQEESKFSGEAWCTFDFKYLLHTTSQISALSVGNPSSPIVLARDSSDLRDLMSSTLTSTSVVLEFVASWCGLCAMIAPQMELLAEEFDGDGVRFLKADVEDCAEAAKDFGVEVLPSILIIR